MKNSVIWIVNMQYISTHRSLLLYIFLIKRIDPKKIIQKVSYPNFVRLNVCILIFTTFNRNCLVFCYIAIWNRNVGEISFEEISNRDSPWFDRLILNEYA